MFLAKKASFETSENIHQLLGFNNKRRLNKRIER